VLVCALTALIGVHLVVWVVVLAVWGAAIGVAVLNLGIAVGALVGGAAAGIRRAPRG
jgi:hypothetical protein